MSIGHRSTLRVATLNLAHGRGIARRRIGKPRSHFENTLDKIARLLKRESPQIVALQEADGPSSFSGRFCHVSRIKSAADFSYHYHGFHCRLGNQRVRLHYGTALLSQPMLSTPESWAFGVDWLDTKGFVCAQIEFEKKPITVASVHLDFKSTWTRQLQTIHIIRRLRKSGNPLIVMGDFNCGWHQEDALRLLHQHLHLHTYQPDSKHLHTYRANRPRRRLDWILATHEFEFVDFRVWHDQVSDHRGVSADLRWR